MSITFGLKWWCTTIFGWREEVVRFFNLEMCRCRMCWCRTSRLIILLFDLNPFHWINFSVLYLPVCLIFPNLLMKSSAHLPRAGNHLHHLWRAAYIYQEHETIITIFYNIYLYSKGFHLYFETLPVLENIWQLFCKKVLIMIEYWWLFSEPTICFEINRNFNMLNVFIH